MKFEKNLLESYINIDSKLIWRMIEDGLFDLSDLSSFYDMIFKLGTRGALFSNDFIEIANTRAIAKAAALRIVTVYKSKTNPGINFVKLGHTGTHLYKKFGFPESRALNLNSVDLASSRIEIILGINHYLVKNNWNRCEFITPTGPVVVERSNGEKTAYAYRGFIKSFKELGIYTGVIRPIYGEEFSLPRDVCCASCNTVEEIRIAINKAVEGKNDIL